MADDDGPLGQARDQLLHVARVVGDAGLGETRVGRARRAGDVKAQVWRVAGKSARFELGHEILKAPAAAKGAVNEDDGLGDGLGHAACPHEENREIDTHQCRSEANSL